MGFEEAKIIGTQTTTNNRKVDWPQFKIVNIDRRLRFQYNKTFIDKICPTHANVPRDVSGQNQANSFCYVSYLYENVEKSLEFTFKNKKEDFEVIKDSSQRYRSDVPDNYQDPNSEVLDTIDHGNFTSSEDWIDADPQNFNKNIYKHYFEPWFRESIQEAQLNGNIPQGSGIYRYMDGVTVVYIGRGIFANRFNRVQRAEWIYDRIEYTPLNDIAKEMRWEAEYQNRYLESHNMRPKYNKQTETRISDEEANNIVSRGDRLVEVDEV